MTVEAQVGNLVEAVDALTGAVTNQQASILANVASTETNKNAAASSAQASSNSASQAQGFRNETQTARDAAITARDQAQAAAGAAGSGPATTLLYPALNAVLATATDVVAVDVYDTRIRDSDGGAWTQRCEHLSWYSEALNTSTRGARREFPKVAGLVLRNVAQGGNALTIYDLTDLDANGVPRMWMVFTNGDNRAVRQNPASVFALNGRVYVAHTGSSGLTEIRFTTDEAFLYSTGSIARRLVPICQRQDWIAWATLSGVQLVSANCNHVRARVLPGAPRDAANLPTPTIAVSTGAGVSVVHPNGLVANITRASGYSRVLFVSDNILRLGLALNSATEIGPIPYVTSNNSAWRLSFYANGSSVSGGQSLVTGTIGNMNTIAPLALGFTGGQMAFLADDFSNPANGMVSYAAINFTTGWQPGDIRGAYINGGVTGNITGTANLVTNGDFATNDLTGWTNASTGTGTASGATGALVLNSTDASNRGAVDQSFTTVTGQSYLIEFDSSVSIAVSLRVGTTAGATTFLDANIVNGKNIFQFTATSTTTWLRFITQSGGATNATIDNVSVQLALPDRSFRGRGLRVVGTLNRNAVASGADLVAVSGFSASNFLEQPYNADLDFGTSDFSVIGWLGAGGGGILERSDPASGARFDISTTGGVLRFRISDGTNTASATGSTNVNSGGPFHVLGIKRGSTLELWVNGVREATASVGSVGSLNNSSAILRAGCFVTSTANWTGSIALLRITGYAPTPAQIRRMFEDERPLFQPNAACFLGGTSNAVNAMSFDESRNVLLVGTGDGVSEFSGLRRVNYLDTTNTALTNDAMTAVAGAGGFRLMAGAAQAIANAPARNGVDEFNRYPSIMRDTDLVARGVTTDATPLVLSPRLFVGEREMVTGLVHVVGRLYGREGTQRFATVLRLSAHRDGGGNVTLGVPAARQALAGWDTTASGAAVNVVSRTTATLEASLVVDTTAQTVGAQVFGLASNRIVWEARAVDIVRITEG